MLQMSLFSAAVTMVFVMGTAHAYFVWLEYDGHGPARAYFGEWAEDVREKTQQFSFWHGRGFALAHRGRRR
jgi:hypothetical protein